MGRNTTTEKINSDHVTSHFDCGEESLDIWLNKRALKNSINEFSQTFVLCVENYVIAYYCLSTSSVIKEHATKSMARNSPTEIPTVKLGRLAVDKNYHSQGIGRKLMQEIFYKTVEIADVAGVKALTVDAISDSAKDFYLTLGFRLSRVDPYMLMISVKELKAAIKKIV